MKKIIIILSLIILSYGSLLHAVSPTVLRNRAQLDALNQKSSLTDVERQQFITLYTNLERTSPTLITPYKEKFELITAVSEKPTESMVLPRTNPITEGVATSSEPLKLPAVAVPSPSLAPQIEKIEQAAPKQKKELEVALQEFKKEQNELIAKYKKSSAWFRPSLRLAHHQNLLNEIERLHKSGKINTKEELDEAIKEVTEKLQEKRKKRLRPVLKEE